MRPGRSIAAAPKGSFLNESTFQWIGTGSAFNPILGHTSFLVSSAGPRTLLVDCGATVPLKLIELNLISRITDIVVTHTHADHIGGLEGLAFYLHFALGRKGAERPALYFPSASLAEEIWEHALRAGMAKSQDQDGQPCSASIETYFDVRIGREVAVAGLPSATLFETRHIAGLENYGLEFDNGVFYSGDTVELPPHHPRVIFQDCQMARNGGGDVHISYEELLEGLPKAVRAKTYLTHLNATHPERDPAGDGFAGYVMPGQAFHFPEDFPGGA